MLIRGRVYRSLFEGDRLDRATGGGHDAVRIYQSDLPTIVFVQLFLLGGKA